VLPSTGSLVLTQSNGQIVPGSKQFTAEATINDGSTLDATNKVSWSLNPSLGMVQGGNATVTAPGIFTVTATNGNISGTATLTATSATTDRIKNFFTMVLLLVIALTCGGATLQRSLPAFNAPP
jgi:hypothetical protein